RAAPEAPPCVVWPGPKKDDVEAVATARALAKAEAEDEHRRLLYVAMTRAAERLIVCGSQGKYRPAGCWYDLVVEGLAGKPGFDGDERDRLVAGVLGLLADDRFAPLFAPGSRAEVPIVGRLHRPGRPDILVSGQIDRLVVTADAVLIADYKTNQVVPDTPQAAP